MNQSASFKLSVGISCAIVLIAYLSPLFKRWRPSSLQRIQHSAKGGIYPSARWEPLPLRAQPIADYIAKTSPGIVTAHYFLKYITVSYIL